MQPESTSPKPEETAVPDPVAELPLPRTETYAVPAKKPMKKILLAVLAIIAAAAAGAGFALLQSK